MMWSHYIHKDPVETFDDFLDIMSNTHVTDIPELEDWTKWTKKVTEGLIIKNPNLSVKYLTPKIIEDEIRARLKYDVAEVIIQKFDEQHPTESRIEIKFNGGRLHYFFGCIYGIHVDGILRSMYTLKRKMGLQQFIDWLPEFDKEEMHNYSPLWDYRSSSMY
jgi:hypothetical protein